MWVPGKESEVFGEILEATLNDSYKFEYTIIIRVENMPTKLFEMKTWLSPEEAYKYEPESLDWEEHSEYAEISYIEEYVLHECETKIEKD